MFVGTPPVVPIVERICHPGHIVKMPDNERIMVNPNGTLKNVIVYVKDAPLGEGGGPQVVLDQVECRYQPHVIALQVGQPLIVKDSDPGMFHNVNFKSEVNPPVNLHFTDAGTQGPVTFKAPEFFQSGCDVHPWMSAWIGVFDHPYFAVTGDDGTFEIKNVPPGNYTLAAWHETLPEVTQSVNVENQKTVEAVVTFSPK
jgi:hypothetical protein